jgi:hypothetical protein
MITTAPIPRDKDEQKTIVWGTPMDVAFFRDRDPEPGSSIPFTGVADNNTSCWDLTGRTLH